MSAVRLDQIVFDAGTQVRAAIDPQVVTDYAEQMTEGATFPPIVLFHDGTQHYLADGFHRFMAAQRIQAKDIAADVQPGTKEDAVWFALGANRTNGKRLTEADKTHAVALAIRMWPQRLHTEIAAQVGCSPSLVSKASSKYTSESGRHVLTGRALRNSTKREAVRALVRQGGGMDREQIASRANVSKSFVSKVRAEMGATTYDRTRDGVIRRRTRLREMAAEGHTSRQMAAELGLSEEGCRNILRKEAIHVPADKVARGKRHDANRIVDQIVSDAENLTEGVNLIAFGDLDRAQLPGWLKSLQESRDKLGGFIRRLMKEQQNHGEAA